jgi:hypothetical protein
MAAPIQNFPSPFHVNFGRQLIHCAFTTGQLHAEGMALKATVNPSIKNYEPILTFFERLNKHQKDAIALVENAEKIDESVFPYHIINLSLLSNQIELCYDSVVYPMFYNVIDIEFNKIDRLFTIVSENLNIFHADQTEDHFHKVSVQLKKLNRHIKQLDSFSQQSQIGLSDEKQGRINKIKILYNNLVSQLPVPVE